MDSSLNVRDNLQMAGLRTGWGWVVLALAATGIVGVAHLARIRADELGVDLSWPGALFLAPLLVFALAADAVAPPEWRAALIAAAWDHPMLAVAAVVLLALACWRWLIDLFT